MKRRHCYRIFDRQDVNAALCGLTLTDYLALPRRERKRRLAAARKEGADRG